jgi:hypothetical protein
MLRNHGVGFSEQLENGGEIVLEFIGDMLEGED